MDVRLFAYIEKLKNENEFLVRHHRQCSLGDRHFTQPNYVEEGFTHDQEAVLTVRPPSQSHPHHPPDLSYPPLLQLPLPHPPQFPLHHPPHLPLHHPPQLPHPIPPKSPDSVQPTRHPKSKRRPKKKLWEKYGDNLRWHEGDNQVRIVEDNQVRNAGDNQVRIVEDNQVRNAGDNHVRMVEDDKARNKEDFGNNDDCLNERIKLILRGISLADAQDPLETLRQCSKELGNTKPQNPLELIKNYSIISNHTKRLAERARKVHAFQELIFVSACEVLLKNGYKLELIDELMKLCISDSSTKNLERLRGGARWFCSLVSSQNAAWEHRITEHLFNCALSVSQYSILYSNAKKSTPYVLKHLEGIRATGGQDDVVDAKRVNNFTGPTAGGQDDNGLAQVRRNEASDAAGGVHNSELSSDFIYMCMPVFVQAVLGKRFSLLNISKALTFGEHYHTIEMEDRNPYVTKKMEWLFDKYVSIRDEASPEPRKGKRKRTRNDSSLKGKSKGFRQAVHRESSAREPLASIEPICNNAMPFVNQHEMEGGDSHHTIWNPSSTEAPLGAERIAVHNLVSGCPSPDGSSNNSTVISGLSSMSSEVDCRDDEPAGAVGNDSNQGSNQSGCVEYGQLDASQQLCGTVDAPILFPNNNPNTLNAGNDQLNNGDTYGLNTSAVDYNPHNLATFAFDYNNPQDLATFAFDYNNPQDLATFAFNYNNPHNLATSAFDYDNPQDLATFASNYNTAYNQPQSCPPH